LWIANETEDGMNTFAFVTAVAVTGQSQKLTVKGPMILVDT
jgi:hypothetical protein